MKNVMPSQWEPRTAYPSTAPDFLPASAADDATPLGLAIIEDYIMA